MSLKGTYVLVDITSITTLVPIGVGIYSHALDWLDSLMGAGSLDYSQTWTFDVDVTNRCRFSEPPALPIQYLKCYSGNSNHPDLHDGPVVSHEMASLVVLRGYIYCIH